MLSFETYSNMVPIESTHKSEWVSNHGSHYASYTQSQDNAGMWTYYTKEGWDMYEIVAIPVTSYSSPRL